MDEELGPELTAISDAVLRISGDLDLRSTLRAVVDAAHRVAGARYTALGIPDGHGGFSEFLTAGMSPALWDAIGPLPRTHGLLGAMLDDPRPFRTPDIEQDPRFEGWPAHHPHMHSFLGVPIVSRGRVTAAFYLTDRAGAEHFSLRDQRIVEILAAHAAIAIDKATLFEAGRELSVVQERNRLARELHDSVVQQLFGAKLTAAAAAGQVDAGDPGGAQAVRRVEEIVSSAIDELRSIVFALRPADLRADGLAATLRKHVETVGRVYDANIALTVVGERRLPDQVEGELFRIAQEAVTNAVRHAGALRVDVRLEVGDGVAALTVADDGIGFDPAMPSEQHGHLGLSSMRERAEGMGGALVVDARPGQGTTVRAEVAV